MPGCLEVGINQRAVRNAQGPGGKMGRARAWEHGRGDSKGEGEQRRGREGKDRKRKETGQRETRKGRKGERRD